MKFLIVAATKEEIMPSIPTLQSLGIPYLITGVGMTATAYQLGKALQTAAYDVLLNVGIAGSFNKDMAIGDVFYIHSDSISELGAEDDANFLSLVELGFGETTWAGQIPDRIEITLPHAEAITVNTVHGNPSTIAALNHRLPHVALESMEGAAVYYVAAMEKTAAIQVRAISNFVEKRNRSNWNIPLAIKNLNHWLQDFVGKHAATNY